MTWNELLRFGASGIVAWAALAGAGSAIGGDTYGSSQDGPPIGLCAFDSTANSGSSDCKRSGRCGQADCCYSEITIPPHDVLIPGTKRIVSWEKFPGKLTLRRCDQPVWFLGFLFGGFDCEIEHQEDQGVYFRYVLAPCPPEKKEEGRSSSSGTER